MEDESSGTCVCVKCGVVNEYCVMRQGYEERGMSEKKEEGEKRRNEEMWKEVYKVPGVMVNEMYEVGVRTMKEEIAVMRMLHEKENKEFKWKEIAKEMKVKEKEVTKWMNKKKEPKKKGRREEIMEMVEKIKMTEGEREKARELAERCKEMPRSTKVIVAGIIEKVTGKGGCIRVSETSRREIKEEIKKLKM